ncbi:MAG: DJ-1/PfpI family protein [Bacteroidales bacterium]|nr:DJ-1/PfpI family protein [Bacteroidales bacterium]
MKTVYVFIAEGFEDIEAITPIDILRRAELNVVTVSITSDVLVTSAHNITIKTDTTINKINTEDADLLILPGGMPGSNNLNSSELLKSIISKHNDKKGLIAAICAAPIILGDLGILKGKQAICYPSYEPRLKGATIVNQPVVVDGNIITAKGVGAAIKFSLKLIEILLDKTVSDIWSQKLVVEY